MMRSRSSSWLLLSSVVLLILIIVEIRFQVGTGSGAVSTEKGASLVGAPPAPRFALRDREAYSETLARPLFMPDRRAPEAETIASSRADGQTVGAKPNRFALSAVIIVDKRRTALLMDTVTGDVSRVKEGESVAGWRIEEIHEGSAVLRNGDEREELSLRIFAAPAPVPSLPARGAAKQGTATARSTDGAAAPDGHRRRDRQPLRVPRASKSQAN